MTTYYFLNRHSLAGTNPNYSRLVEVNYTSSVHVALQLSELGSPITSDPNTVRQWEQDVNFIGGVLNFNQTKGDFRFNKDIGGDAFIPHDISQFNNRLQGFIMQ